MKFRTPARIVYDACEELGFTVRRYSGRGMCGKECLGFTTASVLSDVAQLAALLAIENMLSEPDRYDLFEHALEDDMGKEKIVYFPQLKWSEVRGQE